MSERQGKLFKEQRYRADQHKPQRKLKTADFRERVQAAIDAHRPMQQKKGTGGGKQG